MSSDEEISSGDNQVDEESSVSTTADDGLPEPEERNPLTVDDILWEATERGDAETMKQALQNGANVNAVRDHWTPLMMACRHGYDQMIRILLDAGADSRWRYYLGWSAIYMACEYGHLSTVQLLINHDNGLLEMTNNTGWTPLFVAVSQRRSDIVQFLLDSGADPHHVDLDGETALMHACYNGSLEIARLLLAAGADVEARNENQYTALHKAVFSSGIETMLELILQHNANMFAVNEYGHTPFDFACASWSNAAIDRLLEIYGNKLTHNHGRLAFHELLKVTEYSFADEDEEFHPPLNPLQIILPLGKLKLVEHWRTLLQALDTELIRIRDDSGKLPIHIACQANAPVEMLSTLVEIDSTTLQIVDNHSGSLPIHSCCSGVVEYSSVRYLVEQGGIGTLTARNHEGALPLHVLCGSTNPSWRIVHYLIQSFPGSVAMQTNAGQYPFMVAASNSAASRSVVYELVRANPGLVVPS